MNQLRPLVILLLYSVPLQGQAQEDVIEKITVTGTRIAKPAAESNSPLIVVEGEQFQLDAETNVVRQLQLIPSFTPERAPDSGNGNTFTGSYIDLRGLERKRTLVLVNGRRWITGVSDGGVDVSTIPPELIERVEIVTGGASATYGADAVAGVVNFILRDDFDGVDVSLQSGVTERGEATNHRVSLTGGSDFADGEGSGYFHVSWDETEELLANGRSFLDPALTNSGGELVPVTSTDITQGSALVNGVRAVFDPRGELFSAPGVVNEISDADLFNPGRFARLQIPAEKVTLAAGLDYDVNDRVQFNVDALYARDEVVIRTSTQGRFLGQFPISVDNPFVGPLTQQYFASLDDDGDGLVNVPGFTRRFDELERITFNDRNSYYIGTGLNVDFDNGWNLETFATYNETVFEVAFFGFPHFGRLGQALDVVSGPNGPECRIPTFESLDCVPLNVYGEGTITPEMARFIDAEGAITGVQTDFDAQIVLSRDLLELPAGALGIAGGVEWRRSTGSESPNDVWRTGSTGIRFAEFKTELEQTEGFLEAVVPILDSAPFAEYLGLELGVRFTQFSPGDDAWTYKALADWAPAENEQLRFRGGVQRATRAPTAFEIGAQDQFFDPLRLLAGRDPCFTGDPLSGDVRTSCVQRGVPTSVADTGAELPADGQFIFKFFGNPDLEPETADTLTVGTVLTDALVEDLTFSIDYYQIQIENTIGEVPTGVLFDRCYQSGTGGTHPFCDEIVRDPDTGVPIEVNSGFQNIGEFETSGVDLTFDYTRAVPGLFGSEGNLHASFTGTRLLSWEQQSIADDPETRFACEGLFGSSRCGRPRPEWKSLARVTWSEGAVMAALTWKWVGSVTADATVFDPDFAEELALTEVSGQHYLDLAAVWAVNETLEIRGGIDNLTDNDPPIVGVNQGTPGFGETNTFFGQWDSIGRRYFVGAKVSF